MTLRGRAVALIIPVIEFPGPVGALPITSVVNAAPSGPYWDRTANRGTSDLRVQLAILSLCVGCLIQAWFFFFNGNNPLLKRVSVSLR